MPSVASEGGGTKADGHGTSPLPQTMFGPPRALIFDFDGTLVDSHEAHYRAFCDTLAPFGLSVDRDWFLARTGTSTQEAISQFAEERGIRLALSPEKLAERSEEHFLSHLDDVREIARIAIIAREMRGRLPMAIASGGVRRTIEATAEALGLSEYFDVTVTREDVAAGKPAPDLFLLAASRLGVEARYCLVFEDSLEGLRAAHAAGMAVVDVRGPFWP